jgi:hypothetical protein
MKALLWFGLTAGGVLGSWIGGLLDHGNWLGVWGILLGAIGSLLGIWAAYKAAQNFLN